MVQKKCCDKDVLDCDCDQLRHDALFIDYDYVQAEGTEIQDPTHVGTYQYRALPLLVCAYT